MENKQHLKNFGFSHKAGILMAVSSLPSKYGIGSFGKPAFDFIDFLADCKQTVWQVLPLNPTAYGDSPYQSPSSFAGNPYFIDLDILRKEGLLTADELKDAKNDSKKVDYGWLFNTRYVILRKAYARFSPTADFKAFKRKQASWLDDYALFMALKVKNNYASWQTWTENEKSYKIAKENIAPYEEEMEFWRFLQYEFFTQWNAVHKYAKKKGIKIVGDMPIYVALDSVEVWSNPDEFLLDENLAPTLVAGCPPDGFSADGQLWGNPIYNWDNMRANGFSWWINRVRHAKGLYDIIRIDHFRGFAGYYVIRFGEPTARNGWWQQGYGKELFDAINSEVDDLKIIVEDLGFITDDVRDLLTHTAFPGMKNLQFAFFDDNSEYLPRMYSTENCVVYTATHDSDNTREWCRHLDGYTKIRFDRECPHVVKGRSRVYDLIAFAHNSIANLSVVPLQDYLELDNSARMNTPAVAYGNWAWRASKRFATKALKEKILAVTVETHRQSK